MRKTCEYYPDMTIGKVALPSANQSRATDMYGDVMQKPDAQRLSEIVYSTTGVLEEDIQWGKIYGLTELGWITIV